MVPRGAKDDFGVDYIKHVYKVCSHYPSRMTHHCKSEIKSLL